LTKQPTRPRNLIIWTEWKMSETILKPSTRLFLNSQDLPEDTTLTSLHSLHESWHNTGGPGPRESYSNG
jgi:hypothetical protein